ncbi:hypothetical protein DDB_G0292822 [Dictyostelium discoideum AX4]|uniref:Dictomallein-2 n=1 Tax=Dictyostelium discoideum TaxID=44689 RepID=DTML2_DICDI|nr:hypothetical protein DDB_G0292822 [Dictyostelium discoideum AX4]Q54CQ0.1 RecName: Full=Dictomallein-2; Flags: Precursor [Dictyostelium discoideum]EAL60960.1 hypothetical protein DDB_G0292822 [Dictyostelium discoideum AX4]|eukprot:XP_629366.1 hypothetical protein DDB_G0292822 [Dictyostelium discoideum AX4]
MKLILIYLILVFNLFNFINCQNILKVSNVRFAQTHVIPIEGKSWNIQGSTKHMSIVGKRRALLLASFQDQNLSYFATIWYDGGKVGMIQLNDPSQLPLTEDNGEKYSKVHHSGMIPKEWVRVGMKIQFSSFGGINGTEVSDILSPDVGQDYTLKMWILPFYLFGANDTNTQPFSKTKGIDSGISKELIEKWSCSDLQADNHPIQKIDWPYFVMEPRSGNPAMVITNSDQKKDGYAIMNGVLSILWLLRGMFGESSSSIQIYSPLLHLDAKGRYADTYGGLGGSSAGTGNHRFTGIFIHEQGHAMGLPHAGEAYDNKRKYPYKQGSLSGSEWGFDANHNEFLGTFIPPTAELYKTCKKNSIIDSKGRCVKQSVMQSGAGDQSSKYRYSMFADFEMTTIQNYFKNSIYYDETNGKYKKWNDTSKSYYAYKPITKEKGFEGVDENTPIERNVDIYSIIFTYSTVEKPKVGKISQIYPLLKSKGNLIRQFDPTNKKEMDSVNPKLNGEFKWYCNSSGCDYTIRVTFYDSSLKHVLLQQGKRKYKLPTGSFRDNINDPKSSDSFMLGGVNIKANKKIKKVELLETPFAWNGIPKNPTVLVSKSF